MSSNRPILILIFSSEIREMRLEHIGFLVHYYLLFNHYYFYVGTKTVRFRSRFLFASHVRIPLAVCQSTLPADPPAARPSLSARFNILCSLMIPFVSTLCQ